jgi:hypothetical protein
MILCISGLLIGCGSKTEVVPTPQEQQLRVHNASRYAIQALTVRFPEDNILIGSLPPNATSDYFRVPHGVYPYAAYHLVYDDQVVDQPVVDFMGETPLDGVAFTYTIDILPSNPYLQVIQLIAVKKEE